MSAVLSLKKIFFLPGRSRCIPLSLLVMSILYGIVAFLEVFLICHPMAVDWNADIHGTCGDQVVSYVVLEILGLLLDCAILATPIPCILRLQIPLARRIWLVMLFSLGIL